MTAQQPSGGQRTSETPRSWIGVLVDLQMTTSERPGEMSFRIVVDQVSEGGPAQAGGLRPGDRILAVEGAAVSYDRWMSSVPSLGPGDPLRLTVVRTDGSTANVTIVAQARPPSNRSRLVEEMHELER